MQVPRRLSTVFTMSENKLLCCEKQSYKWCFVPGCRNNSTSSTKLFILVPRELQRRTEWFEASRRTDANKLTKTHFYCCQDHFDLEEDLENYMRLKLTGSGNLRVKSDVIPHKFACQNREVTPSKVSSTKLPKNYLEEIPPFIIPGRKCSESTDKVSHSNYLNALKHSAIRKDGKILLKNLSCDKCNSLKTSANDYILETLTKDVAVQARYHYRSRYSQTKNLNYTYDTCTSPPRIEGLPPLCKIMPDPTFRQAIKFFKLGDDPPLSSSSEEEISDHEQSSDHKPSCDVDPYTESSSSRTSEHDSEDSEYSVPTEDDGSGSTSEDDKDLCRTCRFHRQKKRELKSEGEQQPT